MTQMPVPTGAGAAPWRSLSNKKPHCHDPSSRTHRNVDRGRVASGDVPAQKRHVRLVRTPEEQAEEDEFLAVYGRWKPLSPAQVVDELARLRTPMVGSRRLGHRGRHRLSTASMMTPISRSSRPTSRPSSTISTVAGMSGTTSAASFIHWGIDGPPSTSPGASCGCGRMPPLRGCSMSH